MCVVVRYNTYSSIHAHFLIDKAVMEFLSHLSLPPPPHPSSTSLQTPQPPPPATFLQSLEAILQFCVRFVSAYVMIGEGGGGGGGGRAWLPQGELYLYSVGEEVVL